MPSCLGQKVKALRKSAGLTQDDLGKSAGSGRSLIWEIEKKGSCPSAEKVQKIADALGTTVEYLVDREDVSETSASDTAFMRKYKKMDAEGKEKVRKMCEIL